MQHRLFHYLLPSETGFREFSQHQEFYPTWVATSTGILSWTKPNQQNSAFLIEFYLKFWYELIRRTLENDNTLGTQIKNILKTLWTIPLLPWFWIKSPIVISVNRDLNYDSNGFKIMKNGPYDKKLWSFLVLKVLRKLYQLFVTQ